MLSATPRSVTLEARQVHCSTRQSPDVDCVGDAPRRRPRPGDRPCMAASRLSVRHEDPLPRFSSALKFAESVSGEPTCLRPLSYPELKLTMLRRTVPMLSNPIRIDHFRPESHLEQQQAVVRASYAIPTRALVGHLPCGSLRMASFNPEEAFYGACNARLEPAGDTKLNPTGQRFVQVRQAAGVPEPDDSSLGQAHGGAKAAQDGPQGRPTVPFVEVVIENKQPEGLFVVNRDHAACPVVHFLGPFAPPAVVFEFRPTPAPSHNESRSRLHTLANDGRNVASLVQCSLMLGRCGFHR